MVGWRHLAIIYQPSQCVYKRSHSHLMEVVFLFHEPLIYQKYLEKLYKDNLQNNTYYSSSHNISIRLMNFIIRVSCNTDTTSSFVEPPRLHIARSQPSQCVYKRSHSHLMEVVFLFHEPLIYQKYLEKLYKDNLQNNTYYSSSHNISIRLMNFIIRVSCNTDTTSSFVEPPRLHIALMLLILVIMNFPLISILQCI